MANVNDARTNLSLSSNDVPENILNATVGELTANDPDVGDTITYETQSRADASFFAIVGDELRVGTIGLDFESAATRTVTVRATDSARAFIEQVFTINVSDSDEVTLTTGDDAVLPDIGNRQVNGSAITLTSGDNLDGGAGYDSLVLFGAGTFDLNNVAKFDNFEEVQVANVSSAQTILILRNGTTTGVVASGTEGTRIVASGTAILPNFDGGDGNDIVDFGSVSSWDPNASIDGGGRNSDQLYFRGSNASYELTAATITDVEGIRSLASSVSIIVDGGTLTDVVFLSGSTGSRVISAEAELDLSGVRVSSTLVESTNEDGTNFIVDSKTTAFQIIAGSGEDKITASTLTCSLRKNVTASSLVRISRPLWISRGRTLRRRKSMREAISP